MRRVQAARTPWSPTIGLPVGIESPESSHRASIGTLRDVLFGEGIARPPEAHVIPSRPAYRLRFCHEPLRLCSTVKSNSITTERRPHLIRSLGGRLSGRRLDAPLQLLPARESPSHGAEGDVQRGLALERRDLAVVRAATTLVQSARARSSMKLPPFRGHPRRRDDARGVIHDEGEGEAEAKVLHA